MAKARGRRTRRYVDVIARWRDDGRIDPLSVCWPDGRSFQIEEVLGAPAANAFPQADACTLRYTVRIGGHVTQLFLERDGARPGEARWFVELRPGAPPWVFGRP